MTRETLTRILVLGALTGSRSMAGVTTLAMQRGDALRPVLLLAAAGEMAADKLPGIGNRTDALPLAGRALLGAVAGALVARETHADAVAGGLVGAAAAIVAARLACRWRLRGAPAGLAGGVLEDAAVLAVASGTHWMALRAAHAGRPGPRQPRGRPAGEP